MLKNSGLFSSDTDSCSSSSSDSDLDSDPDEHLNGLDEHLNNLAEDRYEDICEDYFIETYNDDEYDVY